MTRAGEIHLSLEEIDTHQAKSSKTEVARLRKPIADIYLVESYKQFNYENTDRSMGIQPALGYSLMQQAQDLANEQCLIF